MLCIVQQACILWETDTIKEQSGSGSGATSIENLFSIFYHQPTQSQQTTHKHKTQTNKKHKHKSGSGATSIENLFSIFYHQPTQSPTQTQNTNKQKTQTQVWQWCHQY